MRKSRVLFVCIGNSARSQMAEGWLRHLAGDRYEAFSAGTHPYPVHPLTVEVMREAGIDLGGARAKSVDDVPGHFDYVVTTCAEAEADCPALRGHLHTHHWHIPDPVGRAAQTRDTAVQRGIFRRARDLVRKRVEDFLKHPDGRPKPDPKKSKPRRAEEER